MSKGLKAIIFIVVLMIGIIIAGYPFISNFLNGLNSSSELQTYLNLVSNLSDEECEQALKEAREYNKGLLGSVNIGDPFGKETKADDDYYNLLKIKGTPVMACLEVPAIDIKYPVYHGTSDEVLSKGIGHMRGTSLPIGGKGTHSVLTGHTGYSTSKLFTDIDKLEKGDKFYIYTLNLKLAYEVDQIKVVLPSDTSDLKIEPNKDYVTLVTCTPYGINTHRLLVRGKRVPYDEEENARQATKRTESTWYEEYMSAIIIGGGVMAGILILYYIITLIGKQVRKRKGDG
ncbi:MAG: class C sortase [Ruminococcus sp.]|nr:class C sortase [Ruminococcus sp.]